MPSKTILVVDDDPLMQRLIGANLKASGYKAFSAYDGESALELMEQKMPDLVVLDIMIPGIDGKEICRRIRQWSHVPIIMVSAKTGLSDRIDLLDTGADDYLTKPFAVEELLARIRVALRRKTELEAPSKPFFVSGDLRIDFAKRNVTVGGKYVSLTPTEYDLLSILALNVDKVMTHSQLMALVWGNATSNGTDNLRTCVRRLRSKIEANPANPVYIRTSPGVGYFLQTIDPL